MEKNKSFYKSILMLVLSGIAINFIGVKLASYFELPLFLDSIGTLLTAGLGGYMPGIIVGFFSNVLNSIIGDDPITMYYGIISVLFAILASWLARRGVFRSFKKTMLSIFAFSLIGGGLGSVLTWMLYGFSFGEGISAPLSIALHNQIGLGVFWAQLTADFGIDLLDKSVTLTILFFCLRIMPQKILKVMPLGYLYKKDELGSYTAALPDKNKLKKGKYYRSVSLRSKVISMIILTAIVLGSFAISISYIIYKNTTNQRYSDLCDSAVSLMLTELDGDTVEGFTVDNQETQAYKQIEERLQKIIDSIKSLEYMYVYQIKEDGCHVVFDLDTEEVAGGELGEVIPFDQSFSEYIPALLNGEEIQPIISNDSYGWLLSVYKPLLNSDGQCVAYAAADINMENVISDRYIFIIRIVSLLFGASIIIVAFAVWFAEQKIIAPINSITAATESFAYDSGEQRLEAKRRVDELEIETGDEIENLYEAICKTVSDMLHYIDEMNEKSSIITGMQDNIIISFANLVEDRDENTGNHIKRTAAYVGIVGKAMKDMGFYPDKINDKFLENIVRSAPLHDIGKIKISDIVLNKPGRLSDEEFEIIKTHTTAGREILQHSLLDISGESYLNEAIAMAASHHEKWNGKGYPEGLAGEEIPLSARIIAVADVFDALVSKRSYKEPFSFDKAVAIISEEAGQHFDPLVVKAFLNSLDEIKLSMQD